MNLHEEIRQLKTRNDNEEYVKRGILSSEEIRKKIGGSMSELAMRFAQQVRTSLQLAQLSQGKLAERTGLSRPSIANYESGTQGVSLEHAVLLASVLNFSLDALKGNERRKLIEAELENADPKLKEAILKTLKD